MTAATMLAAVLSCAGAQASTGTKARIALDQREGLALEAVTGHGVGFDHWAIDGVRRPPMQPPLENVWTNADYVQVRWNSLDGAVVWEGAPDASGRIRFEFTVPAEAAPGVYTVVATQTGYDGSPTGGTPTRATFRVLPAPPPSSNPTPAPQLGIEGGARAAQRPAPASPARAQTTRRAASSPDSASTVRAAGEPAAPVAGAPAAAAKPVTDAPRSTALRARGGSRSAGALAQTQTRRTAPAAEGTPVARLARGPAPATATSDDGGVPWQLLAVVGLVVALAAAATAYATRLHLRWSPVSAEDESVVVAPDTIERELRELLAQYEDDRAPELAGRR